MTHGWIVAPASALVFLALVTPGRAADQQDVVFAGYNLENYFQAADFPDGREKVSKSPEAIEAEIKIIQEINPDILGVSEMGPPNEFADFQARLKAAGLEYAATEYVAGPDPERHVALLSRFPIVAHQSLPEVPYALEGREEQVERGFLDVTIAVNGTNIRFIGVHLKSKLKDTPLDDAEIRRNETHLLRQHIDQVLAATPDIPLVVYGDFNDTKDSPPMKEIIGTRGSGGPLRDLFLKDSAGDHWTEYWEAADVYSRIDYILVSRNLYPAISLAKSYIYRSPYWFQASDHRPIVATIRMEKDP
jgi:endonuclease/exonuclease/phosphatase family metal-dependent hydrolase